MSTQTRLAAAYQALMQTTEMPIDLAATAAAIDAGSLTTGAWEASLLTGEQARSSVLPALIMCDAFYGVTPDSTVLANLSAYAESLLSQGHSAAEIWSILGLEFAHNGSFGAAYGAMDNLTFANTIYQLVFGFAPTPANAQTLASEVTALAAAFPAFGSDSLGGKGALFGALLYYAETTGSGRFYTAANTFLSGVADAAYAAGSAAAYGQGTELTARFLSPNAAVPFHGTQVPMMLLTGVDSSQSIGLQTDSITDIIYYGVRIGDSAAGLTEAATVILSSPANGTLSSSSGRYDPVTGIYTVTGSAAAVKTALNELVFAPTQYQVPSSQTVTTHFTLTVTDSAGGSVSDNTTAVTTTAGWAPGSSVTAVYQAMLRTSPRAGTDLAAAAWQIDAGMLSIHAFETSLLASSQAASGVLPALEDIQAFYGTLPSTDVLADVTAYAADLASSGVSTVNIWSILGLQFAHNGSFAAAYGGLDDPGFANAIYQSVFGQAPTPAIAAQLAGEIPTLANAFPEYASDALGGRGALYGALLYYAEDTQQGPFHQAASTFLLQQGNDAATQAAIAYREASLLGWGDFGGVFNEGVSFNYWPDTLPPLLPTPSSTTTISVSSTTIDAGSVSQTIQFLAGTSDDTLVLHAGAPQIIAGFDPTAGDVLDLRGFLAEAQISITNMNPLPNQLAIQQSGNDAYLVAKLPDSWNTTGIALLRDLGGVIRSLDDLTQYNALRV